MAETWSARSNAARAKAAALFSRRDSVLLALFVAFDGCMVRFFSRFRVFCLPNRCLYHPTRTLLFFQAQMREKRAACAAISRIFAKSCPARAKQTKVMRLQRKSPCASCSRKSKWFFCCIAPADSTVRLDGVCNCVAISRRQNVDRRKSRAYDICVLVRVIHRRSRTGFHFRRKPPDGVLRGKQSGRNDAGKHAD